MQARVQLGGAAFLRIVHGSSGQVPTLAFTPNPDLAAVRDEQLLALELLCNQRAVFGRELLRVLGVIGIRLQELAFVLGEFRLRITLPRSRREQLATGVVHHVMLLTISCNNSLDSVS